ncbi:unnamed protein product [Nezara viridula]|uniref:Low molecular weight phosphotyrosine protein phosphatase n=1 Tax=Nezara viridula TaxID=85310 RepID=A0A9P0DYD6_NEZVI|nr:unnamed protein product [Nezara viridula]
MALRSRSVIFVCFGNICRSPMAEAIFRKMLEERGLGEKWEVDSAGVATWFIGSCPDPRAISALSSRNYTITRRARQVTDNDFNYFEYMLAVDDDILADLERMAPDDAKSKRELLGNYDPSGDLFIDDPYFTKGDKEFLKTLDHCKRCCEGFLKRVVYGSK